MLALQIQFCHTDLLAQADLLEDTRAPKRGQNDQIGEKYLKSWKKITTLGRFPQFWQVNVSDTSTSLMHRQMTHLCVGRGWNWVWTAYLCSRCSDRSNSAPAALNHLFRAYSSLSFPLQYGKILSGLLANLSSLSKDWSEKKVNSTAGFPCPQKPLPKSTGLCKKGLYTLTTTLGTRTSYFVSFILLQNEHRQK